MTPISETTSPDGRHARRERNRSAVIEAMLSLLADGHIDIPVEELAKRSGVSASSIFRYFDGLEDLSQQTIETHFERNRELFDLPSPGTDSRRARIDGLVATRTRLHEATAPVARVARMRAPSNPTIADALQRTRSRFLQQVRDHFASDLDGRPRADADDRVAAIDALTSFESWDLLRRAHGRSSTLVARAWTSAIDGILD